MACGRLCACAALCRSCRSRRHRQPAAAPVSSSARRPVQQARFHGAHEGRHTGPHALRQTAAFRRSVYYSDSDSLIVWLIVTYGCVSWMLKKHTTDNIQAFEMWCYRRALRIPYVDHVSNEEVLEWVNQPRLLLGKIRSQKLRYFGHIARRPSLQNNIALGYMPGTRRQGGQ